MVLIARAQRVPGGDNKNAGGSGSSSSRRHVMRCGWLGDGAVVAIEEALARMQRVPMSASQKYSIRHEQEQQQQAPGFTREQDAGGGCWLNNDAARIHPAALSMMCSGLKHTNHAKIYAHLHCMWSLVISS